MPSRAEIRATVETALRALSIAILALMLWLSLDRGRPERIVSARSANLSAAVRDWSLAGLAPDRATIQVDRTPTEVERDWLRALSRSGSEVDWNGNLAAAAVSVQTVASPEGGIRVLVAAPRGTRATIEDDLGVIEGENAQSGGATFNVPAASGTITAKVGSTTAHANTADSVRLGKVLVIGGAGWESKFVTAALEEAGWKVDSDVRVAPSVKVTQGSITSLDTTRYSAVIALDATASARAGEIGRYVASGGGLILSGAAGALDVFAALRAGSTGNLETPSALEDESGAATIKSLALVPIVALRSDAIRLDARGGISTVAARRHGAGRVLQTGYVDTWRWRMSGGDDAPRDHRRWWSRALASVAYAPIVREAPASADNAPVASLVHALGNSSPQRASLASSASAISLWLLFAILALSLLAEWTSRRLRGSR